MRTCIGCCIVMLLCGSVGGGTTTSLTTIRPFAPVHLRGHFEFRMGGEVVAGALGGAPSPAAQNRFEACIFERSYMVSIERYRGRIAFHYAPSEFSATEDFPVAQWTTPDNLTDPITPSVERLSWNDFLYQVWLLQAAHLYDQGLPSGISSVTDPATDGVTTITFTLPQQGDGQSTWTTRPSFTVDKCGVILSGEIRSDVCDPRSPTKPNTYVNLAMTCTGAMPNAPQVPRQIDVTFPFRRGTHPLTFHIEEAEPLPPSAKPFDYLPLLTDGLVRAFSQDRYRPTDNPPALAGASLSTLGSGRLRLADYHGRHVLVHFWASWMPPEPELLDQLRAISGVAMVGVSLDVSIDDAREFARAKGMNWPQVFAGARKMDFVKQFGVQSLPACVLIRPDGRPDPSVEFTRIEYDQQDGRIATNRGMVTRRGMSAPKRHFQVAPVVEALAGQVTKERSYGGRARAAFGESLDLLNAAFGARGFALRYTFSDEDDELQAHIRTDEQMLGLGVLYDAGAFNGSALAPVVKTLLDDKSYADGNWRDNTEVESSALGSGAKALCAGLQFRGQAGRALEVVITPLEVQINTDPGDKDKGWSTLPLSPAASAALQRQLREFLTPDSAEHRKAVADREAEWRARVQRREADVDEKLAPVAALAGFRPRPGFGAIRFSWKMPKGHSTLVLRGSSWEAEAVPEHGQRYARGDRIGDMEVVYSSDATEFVDSGLTDGTRYVYKAYALDAQARYSAGRRLGASPGKGLRVLDNDTNSEIQIDSASDEMRAQSGALRMEGADPNNDSLTIMIIDSPGKGTMAVKFGVPGRQIQLDARELGDAPVNGAAAYVADFRLSSLPKTGQPPAPPVALPY